MELFEAQMGTPEQCIEAARGRERVAAFEWILDNPA
jgi:hypothetical protein